jgi:hypothetical protein
MLIIAQLFILLFVLSIFVESSSSSSMSSTSLEQFALDAVAKYADSHVEIAMEFSSKACPAFGAEDSDRLVKLGRSLENLVFLSKKEEGDTIALGTSLEQLVEECTLLSSGTVKVSWADLSRAVAVSLLCSTSERTQLVVSTISVYVLYLHRFPRFVSVRQVFRCPF